MLNPNKVLNLPSVTDSSIIFEESLIRIRKDELKADNNSPYPYFTLETSPFAVVILPLLKDGNFLFIEEYRHPTKKILLACPAGYMNENETPLEAAKRELLEETGYQAESFELIGSTYPYAGISAQKNFFVRANNVTSLQPPTLEQSEIIRIHPLSIDQLNALIAHNCELDGNLCTALFLHSR